VTAAGCCGGEGGCRVFRRGKLIRGGDPLLLHHERAARKRKVRGARAKAGCALACTRY